MFFLALYTQYELVRIYIYDISAVSPALYISIILLFLILNFKDFFDLKLYFKSPLLIFVSLYFILLLFYIYINRDNLFLPYTYIYYYIPISSIIFYNIFKKYDLSNCFFYIFMFMFMFESIYILIEIIDEYLGFEIHNSQLISWYLKNDFGRFEGIGSAKWGYHLVLDFFSYLPPALGLRGWPHYSAPFYLISFIGTLIYFDNKKIVSSVIFIIGLICVLALQVKTHYISLIFILLILPFYLKFKYYKLVIIFFSILFVIAFFSIELRTFIFKQIINLIGTQNLDLNFLINNQMDMGLEKIGRIYEIFRFKEYLFILDLPIKNVMFGFDNSQVKLYNIFNRANFELSLMAKAIPFGFIYILMFIFLAFLSIYRSLMIISNKNVSKNKVALFISASIFILFIESIHFGEVFSEPLYGLFFIFVAYSFSLQDKISFKK